MPSILNNAKLYNFDLINLINAILRRRVIASNYFWSHCSNTNKTTSSVCKISAYVIKQTHSIAVNLFTFEIRSGIVFRSMKSSYTKALHILILLFAVGTDPPIIRKIITFTIPKTPKNYYSVTQLQTWTDNERASGQRKTTFIV